MRRAIIAGNWKMNKTIAEALALVNGLKRELYEVEDVELVVCPPYTALSEVAEAIYNSNIQLGAQDLHWEAEGAFTGEVSGAMLKDVGCKFVIIGHSERRQFFGETNESVNKKTKAALKVGLTPIVCVGENLNQREKRITFDVVREHVEKSLEGINDKDILKIVIAYEPVWAIGTGKTATPQQAQEVQEYIRKLLNELYNKDTAEEICIQYGGSVKPDNIADLMAQKDIDGAVVGGASLELYSFVQIVKNSRRKK
jgi:triosephosphate isomerase